MLAMRLSRETRLLFYTAIILWSICFFLSFTTLAKAQRYDALNQASLESNTTMVDSLVQDSLKIVRQGANNDLFNFDLITKSQSLAYRLKNVEDSWTNLPEGSNQLSFDNLGFGDYELQLSLLDSCGRPTQPFSIHFEILAPWYLSKWAIGAYIIIFCLAVLCYVTYHRMRNRYLLEQQEKRQIQEQSRRKMDFLANLSHDLKSPLNMILAPLSHLMLVTEDVGQRYQLELAHRNGLRLAAVINQLIDFDNVENNEEASLMPSRVDFVALLKSTYAEYENGAFRDKQLKCRFQCNIESCFLLADAMKVETAFSNVLNNAAKFTPAGGSIAVRVFVNDKLLRVVVKDSGVGISAKDLPYVTQRFFKSSNVRTPHEGAGIGLFLARAYTELHGGTFIITSEEGKGTSVIMSFPRSKNDIGADEEIEKTENVLPKKTVEEILVADEINGVDDNAKDNHDSSADEKDESAMIIEENEKPLVVIADGQSDMTVLISDLLSPYYRCQTADNGKVGLELCASLLPDLIIVDMMMPVMNGLEMCQNLRNNLPTSTIPIIMLTAEDDRQAEQESLRLNIDAYMVKPFDANVLLLRTRQLIEKFQQTRERMSLLVHPKDFQAISSDEKFLMQVTSFIDDHVDDFELNVNTLCEEMEVSNKQVYRKLKQLTGQSPVEYIRTIRMKKAAMLLSQQKFSVAEVMYMVAYSNSSYFSKCFQTEFGVTPKQYKIQMQLERQPLNKANLD